MGSRKAEIISLDRFFKPLQQLPKYRSRYHEEYRPDFNRPDSLYVRKMASFCKNLSGKRVYLLDGHFSLYFPLIRNLLDVKCFVDSGIREMLARRTRRNLKADYGGSRDDIIHYNEECVEPNYRRFLLPTKKYADIIIPNGKSAAGRKVAIKYCGLKAGVFVSVGKDIIHAKFPPEARPRRPHCGGGHPRH